MDESLAFAPASELVQLVRSKQVAPTEIVSALFARINEVDPHVNAYCTLAEESARLQAAAAEQRIMRGEEMGPLCGVPIALKDNIETAGIRTTYGSRVFEDFVPNEDAICAARIKAAGAIVVGKTALPEFAAKGVTDSTLFGHTRNPWALDRTAGGSSGGSAAAVAAGLTPVALGTDRAGSVRIPAAFCGVTALKPTAGRIPYHPNRNPWDFVDHIGIVARCVADLDLVMRVAEGPDDRDPVSLPAIPEEWNVSLDNLFRPWRVAWTPDLGFAEIDAEVRKTCEQAAMIFAADGTVDPVPLNLSAAGEAYTVLLSIFFGAAFAETIETSAPMMDPLGVAYAREGLAKDVVALGRAGRRRSEVYASVQTLFRDFDLIVTPTVAVVPFKIGLQAPSEINGKPLKSWRSWFPFTYPFNLTGHPAATVPAGWTAEGLPIGLQIIGRRFADRDVLAACRYFERIRPWAQHRPEIPANDPPA